VARLRSCRAKSRKFVSSKKPDCISQSRCQQIEVRRPSDCDGAFFSVLSIPIFKYLHHEIGRFPHFGTGARQDAGLTGIGEHIIAVPNIVPAIRVAGTIEREFRCCHSFDASLSPILHDYWNLPQAPIPHFVYRALFSTDLTISRRVLGFCAAFFTGGLTRR
jgi:hypothetical protein